MSAAAGAPPPPPPPPPPHNSFDDLPAELLLEIYQYIGLEQFMNLALAIYPTLMRHNLVPELTPETFARIVCEENAPPDISSVVGRMPSELWFQVAQYFDPASSIALIFALGPRFWRFPGRPSKELVAALRIWSRRSRKR
jgi:hypothetical protein